MGESSSSSSSSQTNQTYNTDKRLVVDQGIGISSDSSSVTVNALDAGIVGDSLKAVTKALDTVSTADAVAGDSLNRIIGLADKLFDGAGKLVTETQKTAATFAQSAAADNKGVIDNKTIMVLGVAGAAAVALSAWGKK